MDMSDKYAVSGVFDFNLFDESGNFIVLLNTLQANEIIYSKKKTYLKIKDATIDMKFMSYLNENRDCVYSIWANSDMMNVESGGASKGNLNMSKARIVNLRIYNESDSFSRVTIVFEAIGSFDFDCVKN